MTKTTFVMNITVTRIVEGDHGCVFADEELQELAKEIKNECGADNVVVEYAKAFVMDENGGE